MTNLEDDAGDNLERTLELDVRLDLARTDFDTICLPHLYARRKIRLRPVQLNAQISRRLIQQQKVLTMRL